MRQRLDQRGVDREQGIEEVGQADAVGLGDEAEQPAVGVEAPGAAGGDDLERRLLIAVDELVAGVAGRVLVGQLDGGGAVLMDIDDRDQAVGEDAPDRGAAGEVFETCHLRSFSQGVLCDGPIRRLRSGSILPERRAEIQDPPVC